MGAGSVGKALVLQDQGSELNSQNTYKRRHLAALIPITSGCLAALAPLTSGHLGALTPI